MFGLITKFKTAAGQRDALIAILTAGTSAMPGCLRYIVAKDAAEADAVWITEVWNSSRVTRRRSRFPPCSKRSPKGGR